MKTSFLEIIIGTLFLTTVSFADVLSIPDFTRYELCKKADYACGQCEAVAEVPTASIMKDFKARSVTEALSYLITQVEGRLHARLNPIYLGLSPSLMDASLTHPKVILKSPEGEWLIAYNTDVKSAAYPTLEVMRFEGRTGRFILEKIEMNEQGKLKVSQNPESCVRCHGRDPKPLWDTYRAWPGMLAGRDDLIERRSLLTPSILKLWEQMGADPRLKLVSPTLTLPQIETGLQHSEWVRIPHVPETRSLKNISLRTAKLAGPAHILFDQLTANLGCLMQKKMKHTLTANEWKAVKGMEMGWREGDDEANRKVLESVASSTQIGSSFLPTFLKIKNAQAQDHHIKMLREANWLVSLGFPPSAANEEAYEFKVPFVRDWFAVEDPGGYRGVEEADPDFLSILELLMGRHGTSMSQFSMSISPLIESGFSAFSFSDQLVRVLQSVPTE